MSLRVTINKGVYEQGRQAMRNGLAHMLTDIHKDAVTNAPIGKAPEDKHPGLLKDSGRFKLQGMKGYGLLRRRQSPIRQTTRIRKPSPPRHKTLPTSCSS